MSVEAITWSNKQRVGSSGAKLVLLALANYADEDGYCWPSRRTLAHVTEMSPDSISRHLSTLEAGGFVEREARKGDRGQRTSDLIRLLLSRPTAAPAAAENAPVSGGTPSANCGGPPSANYGGPLCKNRDTPSAKTGGLEPSIEPSIEKTPLPPEGDGVGISTIDGEEREAGVASAASMPDAGGETLDTQFDVFWAQYGADPAASRMKGRRAWARLGPAERAQALTLLPRFLDHCRGAKRKICDPATYLGERRWEAMANLPAPTTRSSEPPAARPPEADPVRRAVLWALSPTADRGDWPFVEEGSEAWEAWRAAFGAAGLGHRWMRGRNAVVRGADGIWAPARRPGRHFPMPQPPMAGSEATGPPRDRPSAEEVERYLGNGG